MAAWSVTFATVEEAFAELAPLVKGERVLIHAATGGVGLVAVQHAQRVGATVFATAGSPPKVEFLKKMGVKSSPQILMSMCIYLGATVKICQGGKYHPTR